MYTALRTGRGRVRTCAALTASRDNQGTTGPSPGPTGCQGRCQGALWPSLTHTSLGQQIRTASAFLWLLLILPFLPLVCGCACAGFGSSVVLVLACAGWVLDSRWPVPSRLLTCKPFHRKKKCNQCAFLPNNGHQNASAWYQCPISFVCNPTLRLGQDDILWGPWLTVACALRPVQGSSPDAVLMRHGAS